MMGVNYELFWTLNPKTIVPFTKAFYLSQQHKDEADWRLGQYIRGSIASVLNKNAKYPSKPFLADFDPFETEETRRKKIKQRFMAHATLLNQKFRKE